MLLSCDSASSLLSRRAVVMASASQHQRQIQQMKAFILQEANEKRNEINIKV